MTRDDPKPHLALQLGTQRPSLFERAEAAIVASKILVIQTKALLIQSKAILEQWREREKCFGCASSAT